MVHRQKFQQLNERNAGIDVAFRQRLWDSIWGLNYPGVTIGLTTHYLEKAEELCDQIANINKGAIISARSKA